MGTIEVYEPTGKEPKRAKALNPRLPDLQGRVIGFEIGWDRFKLFMGRIEELLREQYEVAEVIRVPSRGGAAMTSGRTGEEARQWDDLKRRSDAAILGLGT